MIGAAGGRRFLSSSSGAGWKRKSALLDRATQAGYGAEAAVMRDQEKEPYRFRKALRVPAERRGIEILNDPLYNKGTGFEEGERDRLGLRGLVPPAVLTMEQQLLKIMAAVRALPDDLSKHTYLTDLHDRNATLFHRVVVRHIEELAPLIYTPTVGRACQLFETMFRRPRGMYFTRNDVGHMAAMTANWPAKDVRVVVVTDGSRILGLGDLGSNGMGIPIGKLALYCAAGGIAPHRVLPVVVDVGTDNRELLEDPFYLGVREPRLTGDEYFAVVDEFVRAIYARWPDVLVQFEDFSSRVAKPLLDRYRDHRLCFNDDVQGTGATVVAGALAALRLQEQHLRDQTIVVCGAGSAGVGCANALYDAVVRGGGLSRDQAALNFHILDEKGLIARDGGDDWDDLTRDQQFFGSDFKHPNLVRGTSLVRVIETVKPTMLLGLTTVRGLFDREVVDAFSANCPLPRPILMPLSNPTANAEATAKQVYEWTDGKAIFASGSPFDPVTLDDGRTLVPSQCNNFFIFPGLGLGATLAKATRVSDAMLHAASLACAAAVTQQELDRGQVFPSVSRIRDVSKAVALAVIRAARDEGLNRLAPLPRDLDAYVTSKMYYPFYVPLYQSPYGS
ncbi:hypothetical protein CTAYLR_007340 [Chrysophaeum taylorii]|uniref:Malic enzyme n=1 Tax=Chrysophaeum taylorii TaxID=2483200 RepID=A0AAD7XNW2_9STRA|nr:hypothetical protein CTAYLR_007340 [Chrysophaeum taylorii]